MTPPVEQLTRGTGLIATASAAANFGQPTASMRLPATAHRGKSIELLIVSVIGMTKVNQSIEIAKTMIYGAKGGMVVKVESPTVTSTSTPRLNVLGREPMNLSGLKRMSDITSIHTVNHLIEVPHAMGLIVVGSTGKMSDLRNVVRGAVFARLQAGYAAPTASDPTVTDLKSSIQSAVPREVKASARESMSRTTVLIAREALRTGSRPMRK